MHIGAKVDDRYKTKKIHMQKTKKTLKKKKQNLNLNQILIPTQLLPPMPKSS